MLNDSTPNREVQARIDRFRDAGQLANVHVEYASRPVLFALFYADIAGCSNGRVQTQRALCLLCLATHDNRIFDSGGNELDGTCTETPPCWCPAIDPSDRGTHGSAYLAR